MDKPKMTEIVDIQFNSQRHKTFSLDAEIDANPGQFFMLWIPEIGEKPMSISSIKPLQFTIKKIGEFTKQLFKLEVGDQIGIRGPYGNGFKPVAGKCLLVGGGCGIAPLRPLTELVEGEVVISAVTKDELLFKEEFEEKGFTIHTATDDASSGFPGLGADLVEKLIEENTYDCIYTCGPEPMMKKIGDLAVQKEIPAQLSLERYMKCGIGICGSCMLDDKRICKEGPVILADDLVGTEFGVSTRDACGCKKKFDDE